MSSNADTVGTTGFHVRSDGFLYCDDVRVCDVHGQLVTSESLAPHGSPAFVYSQRQIESNVRSFHHALKALPVPAHLNFSMKCNYNPQLLKLVRTLGCGVTLVSGTEMKMATLAGFQFRHMLLNGSGKAGWEIRDAIRQGVLLNVDSEFDLQHIIDVCGELGEGTTARVLLRLMFDINPEVHDYLNTGSAGTKFGLDPASLARVTSVLTSDPCPVRVEGLHSHLGSGVKNVAVFRENVRRLLALRQELRARGMTQLRLINVGGGLAIDYQRHEEQTFPFREEGEEVKAELVRLRDHLQREGDKASAVLTDQSLDHRLYQRAVNTLTSYMQERIPRSALDERLRGVFQHLGIEQSVTKAFPLLWKRKDKIPTPADLVASIRDLFVTSRDDDVTLLFEPGRAILGNAGVLMTTVLGFKTSENTNYLVVDGAMNDFIRPSLYGAYHFMHPASPPPPPSAPNTSTACAVTTLTSSIDGKSNITNTANISNTPDVGNISNSSNIDCGDAGSYRVEAVGSRHQIPGNSDVHDGDDDGGGGGCGGGGDDGCAAGAAGRMDGGGDTREEHEEGEEEREGALQCVMDIVGPVCESGDFLAKNRLLPVPARGACVVLHDAGAYGSAMTSRYNLRMGAAEVLVNGSSWQVIRRPDTLEDVLAPFHIGGSLW